MMLIALLTAILVIGSCLLLAAFLFRTAQHCAPCEVCGALTDHGPLCRPCAFLRDDA